MVRFCEFDDNSLVSEVRDAFSIEDECEKLITNFRSTLPRADTGRFDAIAAILLNGPNGNEKYQINYRKFVDNWIRQAAKRTTYEIDEKIILNDFCKSVLANDTLHDVYIKMENWNGWYSDGEFGFKGIRKRTLEFFTGNKQDVSEGTKQIMFKNKIIDYLNSSNEKQIIFTGAPGTGKTYSVRSFVKNEVDFDENRYKFVQFHTSYDYSDFVEGLRPVRLINSESPTFVRLDGVFKKFCRKIVKNNLDELNSKENKSNEDNDSLLEKIYNGENSFKEITTKHYFIIDEINRAELSKVFGELMFGLEDSYRDIENRFDTQYMNLKTYEVNNNGEAMPIEFDCFRKGFFIPHNLYVIGTMNDIDRSVESFDFALRRRFKWVNVSANEIMIDTLMNMLEGVEIENLCERIISMNNVLSSEEYKNLGLTEEYHIGPSYFKNYTDESSLTKIFNQDIVSILYEYTRGRDKGIVNDLIQNCAEKLGVVYEK